MHRILLDAESVEFRLLNDWQRDFPLHERPFERIAEAVGWEEEQVIEQYTDWIAQGMLSRVGAVFAPRRLGAGALVALAVPEARLAEVAARVSAEPGVNHNYEREHTFNLWFVATAADEDALRALITAIEHDTGCAAIVLPLEEEYHIDLGFDLSGRGIDAGRRAGAQGAVCRGDACAMPAVERSLIVALQDGLPLVSRPWAALGNRIGLNEAMVLELIGRMLDEGLIRRLGAVVRHHELGIDTNAMCVWDVPDDLAATLGHRLAAQPGVTLCYRRSRARPHWRYNLFCMIHGNQREAVLAQRDRIAASLNLDQWPHAVLFSVRRFKQVGARYLSAAKGNHHEQA